MSSKQAGDAVRALAAAALVGSSNPEHGSCCSRQAPRLLPCSCNTPGKPCRESACFPWQRAGSLQGSCPALGYETQQGLSSAQPCVRKAEAEGISDSFRMVGVPVVPRPALLLCLLMEHKSLYGCCCWAKSLLKDTQHPLSQNLTPHQLCEESQCSSHPSPPGSSQPFCVQVLQLGDVLQ